MNKIIDINKIENKYDLDNLENIKSNLIDLMQTINKNIDKAIIYSILSIIDEYNEINKKIDDIYEFISSEKILDDNAITNLISEINRLTIIKYEMKDKITRNIMNLRKIISDDYEQNNNKNKMNIRLLREDFSQ